jgi:hypothetical protein
MEKGIRVGRRMYPSPEMPLLLAELLRLFLVFIVMPLPLWLLLLLLSIVPLVMKHASLMEQPLLPLVVHQCLPCPLVDRLLCSKSYDGRVTL